MNKRVLGALGALALLLSTSLPGFSDPVIEDLLIRRVDDRVNVRVVVDNPTNVTERAPVVTLYARPNETAEWTLIKTWNIIRYIKPGYRVARDIFEVNSPELHDMAQNGALFQVKAVVTGPGVHAVSVEKTSPFESFSGR